MKKLFTLILTILVAAPVIAQDIPMLGQKMTNTFMYNPAVAGHSSGSLTYSFRRNFSGISNAPRMNFISVHTPLLNHRIGIGANVFQEDVNFLKNTYIGGALAYHVKFNQANVLSFGVSGEYNSIRLSGNTNSNPEDPEYTRLANGQLDDIDFSFGMLFHNRFVKVGFAANRLATAWIKSEDDFILTNFYSGFVQGMIPLRGGQDLLEPYFAYRKFSETNDAYDVGLYYTYNDMLMGGVGFRKGSIAILSAAFRLNKKLMLGYSHELLFGDVARHLGSANEITLRLDFKEYSYKTNYQADYKAALAYRKKTSGTGARSPHQLHSRMKKLPNYSPNKRYLVQPARKSYNQAPKRKSAYRSKSYRRR